MITKLTEEMVERLKEVKEFSDEDIEWLKRSQDQKNNLVLTYDYGEIEVWDRFILSNGSNPEPEYTFSTYGHSLTKALLRAMGLNFEEC